ncbi:MAG TPA: 2OG-Fe(II) oxygenase [Vitreimonas sp.]|nr:2OG-Fe(II) oxygenase [Vitreimonas sp.]
MAKNAHSPQVNLALQHEREGRESEALKVLEAGAAAGDSQAQLLLAQRLIWQPRTRPLALQLVQQSAQQANADALHFTAVLAAAGVGAAPDWRKAMRFLRKAAERGNARATRQRAAIGSGFDIEQWLQTPGAEMQFESPRIGVIPGFLPAPMCAWLIESAKPQLKPSLVTMGGSGASELADVRTNMGVFVNLINTDIVLLLAQARLGAVLGVPAVQYENPNILRYEAGQEFKPHYDALEPDKAGYHEELSRYGQRVATFLIYLNDDFDGGETSFPLLSWSFKGRTGDALFFWNVSRDGAFERRLQHAGLPPTRGEKWLFSQWVRNKAISSVRAPV